MALSTGQINDAFVNALGRSPTGEELQRYTSRGDLEGSPGQQQLISELGGSSQPQGAQAQAQAQPMTDAQRAEDTTRRIAQEIQTRFKQYETAKGPFSLDEVLVAKQGEAKEQIDPYYNETLSDYLLGVNRKRQRSQEDTRDLLGELQATTESFTGSTKLKLDEALNRAREGFAESGLFESGARFRSEGMLERETGDTLADYTRRAGLREKGLRTGLSRGLEDIGTAARGQERDIERERFTSVETRAGELAKRSGQQYVSGFQQTLSPELQANTNFDLLKQIGIY